jgi:hypothetical protein
MIVEQQIFNGLDLLKKVDIKISLKRALYSLFKTDHHDNSEKEIHSGAET